MNSRTGGPNIRLRSSQAVFKNEEIFAEFLGFQKPFQNIYSILTFTYLGN